MPKSTSRAPARGRVGHLCRGLVAGAAALAAWGLLASPSARACSSANPASVTPFAIPRDGATDVPTATSFVVVSSFAPVDLQLAAGATAVPLDPPTPAGFGDDGASTFALSFWRVQATGGMLPASSDLVLSESDGKGGRRVLTTIHTAAGYDKLQGTPAALKSLTLTRVRYPIAEINSGDCVFAEFIGFVSFDADPAAIPGTPAASIVSTISLAPKYGGAAGQAFTFTGARPFTGEPAGAVTSSKPAWMPYLDPSLEYCAGITSFGYGDIARLPVVSNTVCARVQEISMPGARTDDAGAPGDGGAPDASTPDASVAMNDAAASTDATAPAADAGADAGSFVCGTVPPKGGGGCDAAEGAGGADSALAVACALALLARAALGTRRNRRI
jgi:hypothetical protein